LFWKEATKDGFNHSDDELLVLEFTDEVQVVPAGSP
jgi:hypothetical protein